MLRQIIVAVSLLALSTTACAEVDDEGEITDSSEEALRASSDLSVVFTTPKGDGKNDHSLEDAMIDLVSKADTGSNVRVAIFHFTREKVAQAFIEAKKKRNVDVRIVLDADENREASGAYNSAVQMLVDGLGKDAVTLCQRGKGACIGDNINHNKFLLFSKLTDGARNVVVQSSQNFTGGMLGQHNNAVIVKNDAKLHDAYLSYFRDLVARKLDLSYDRTLEGSLARTFVFPRSGADTIASILDNVRCKKGVSKIRIAMAFFTEERSEIADRLVALKRHDCDVRIAMRKAGDGPVDASIIRTLRKAGVEVGLYPAENGNDIHSKYLLIDSPYDGANGVKRRKLVFTGSHNYTGTALRHNDETLMRIEDPLVHRAFSANWETIDAQTRK